MRKILLLVLLGLLCLVGYSQSRISVFTVPDATTQFGIILPSGAIVLRRDINALYQLTSKAIATNTLTTAAKVFLNNTIDTLEVMNLTVTDNAMIEDTTTVHVLEAKGDSIMIASDLATDHWLYSSTNTLLGEDVAGDNNLTHGGGSEGWYNTFFGSSTGKANTTGSENSFFGAKAGYSNTTADANVYIGGVAGYYNDGSNNVFVGEQAGYGALGQDNKWNTFIGYKSGLKTETASYNAYVGYMSALYNTIGDRNVILGCEAGKGVLNNSFYENNTFIGYKAGYSMETGDQSVFIGAEAGYTNAVGRRNTFIGRSAGYLSTSDRSIFIGYEAGYNETGNQKLYIENSNANKYNALIYGEFDNDFLRVNGKFGIDTVPSYSLHIDGTGKERVFFVSGIFGTGTAHPIALGESHPLANGNAVAGFDARYYITGTGDPNHSVSFQSGITYNSSGTLDDLYGFYDAPTQDAGIITDRYGAYIGAIMGSGRNVTNNYGLYVAGLSGTNSSYAVYTNGSTPSYFGGITTFNSYINVKGDLIQFNDTNFLYRTVNLIQVGGKTTTNTGIKNIFIGDSAGFTNTSGNYNVFIGDEAGYLNTIGDRNVFVGALAGRTNSSGQYNLFYGYSAGYSNTTGYSNCFIGFRSGNENTQGYYNTGNGDQSLHKNTTGNFNVGMGTLAGYSNTTSNNSTFIGSYSGFNSTGANNVFIGYKAGESNTSGSNGICIGYDIDLTSATASNQMNIGGMILSDDYTVAIGIGITTPLEKLHVNGDVLIEDSLIIDSTLTFCDCETLAEDGTIALPTGVTLVGKVWVENVTDYIADAIIINDGSVTIVTGNGNTSNTDVDGNICLYNNGGTPTIKLRLNIGTKKVCYCFKKSR